MAGDDRPAAGGQLAANWRRKQRPEVRAELPEAVADTIACADWPFDADRAGLSDELAAALAQLPATARACLLLRVVLDYGFADIARMLAINENTAMSHVRRARESLRRSLSASGERQPTTRGTR